MNKEELYNDICKLLTTYEDMEECHRQMLVEDFYNILVDVQKYFDFENKDEV